MDMKAIIAGLATVLCASAVTLADKPDDRLQKIKDYRNWKRPPRCLKT